MAMPILVWLMSSTRPTTSSSVRMGVMIVTILVLAPRMFTEWLRNAGAGYCLARPPVRYHIRFCIR